MGSHTVETVQQQNMLKSPCFASSLISIIILRTVRTGIQHNSSYHSCHVFKGNLCCLLRTTAFSFYLSIQFGLSKSLLKGKEILIPISLPKWKDPINSFSNAAILTHQSLRLSEADLKASLSLWADKDQDYCRSRYAGTPLENSLQLNN